MRKRVGDGLLNKSVLYGWEICRQKTVIDLVCYYQIKAVPLSGLNNCILYQTRRLPICQLRETDRVMS